MAEWYRLQLKEKCWEGMREHSMSGYNTGPAPYGYQAERIPHPVQAKRSMGATKSRLALDPVRAPVVRQIYDWRLTEKLGPRSSPAG